jgi:hypothetical protein
MNLTLLAAGTALIMAACATKSPYTDNTVQAERKAYARCAVLAAFSAAGQKPAWEVARMAVAQCDQERLAVLTRLVAENAMRADADTYTSSYMHHLHTAMVNHIAVRLMRARIDRERDRDGGFDAGRTEGRPDKS